MPHHPFFAPLACSAAFFFAIASPSKAQAPAKTPDRVSAYDVIWDSPSADSKGSMPLGNGDIGINVWVEPSGDLVMLLGKSDSFDEFNRLLKLGRVRIKTTPALFSPGEKFTQRLNLAEGSIEIETKTAKLRVWVDANNPVVQVDATAEKPVEAQVILENWRKENRALGNEGPNQKPAKGNWPDKMRVNADTILPAKPGQLAWCHHNIESQWKKNLEFTDLGEEVAKGKDPVLNRTFGAVIRAKDFKAVSNTELKSPAAREKFKVQIYVPKTIFVDSPERWLLLALVNDRWEVLDPNTDAFALHATWWKNFWSRSFIDVAGASSSRASDIGAGCSSHSSSRVSDIGAGCSSHISSRAQTMKQDASATSAFAVSRAYALQRFINACAGRGALPIKFNGSLFTVEGNDPDYRAWGGAYWFQNTREAYWTMPYAGDAEMMEPLFKMYREALPLRMAATKTYYGHRGAFYPETMYFWGNYIDDNYGFDRTGHPKGFVVNPFMRYNWQGGIELVAMMLDTFDITQDKKLRDETLLPIARQVTLFFDEHWKRDARGKVRMDPAQSLETWQTVTNPLPEVAGLHFILPRLLALPAPAADKAQWKKLLADLPPVPTEKLKDGKIRLAPAEIFSNKKNVENPELYAVFPYRLCTTLTGGQKLEQALNAWNVRIHKEDRGWQPNVMQAPMLGLANEAKAMVVSRAAAVAKGYRFPGFFGPNYDWTPEQCHGTNLMTGLQRMLMQCEGKRIVLLPAWPKDWNVNFKLHAPGKTTVEGRVENGEIKGLKVSPESRRKDVEVRKAQ